jgi:hypothetical protein
MKNKGFGILIFVIIMSAILTGIVAEKTKLISIVERMLFRADEMVSVYFDKISCINIQSLEGSLKQIKINNADCPQ